MNNQECIRAAHLAHMTPEEKKEYNKRYYQEHKEEYWGVKSGVDRFKNELQRPKIYVDTKTGTSYSIGGGRDPETGRAYSSIGYASDLENAGLSIKSVTPKKGDRVRTSAYRRQSTPDLNARTSAIQRAQQSTNRLSTPGLNQRLANMKAYTSNSRKLTLSSIASSAVSKGKSIVSSFASAWKSGLSSLKSAFTPKTTSTLSTKRISTVVTPSGYYQRLGRNINDRGTIK